MTHVAKVDDERLVKVKALHEKGLSIRDISERIGVSKTAVSCDLYRLRALPDNSKIRLGDKFQLVVEGWNDGMRMKELADMCGRSETSMKHIIFIMKCYGHIEERKTPTWNKGKRLPISKRHQDMFDKMVAINGWEKMGRTELAARLQREVQMENPQVSLEQTMVAIQKAQIGFQATLHVRNRMVQAYTDIMNMQV